MKRQLNRADKRSDRLAIMIGEDELNDGIVVLRDMTNGEQEQIKVEYVFVVLIRLNVIMICSV